MDIVGMCRLHHDFSPVFRGFFAHGFSLPECVDHTFNTAQVMSCQCWCFDDSFPFDTVGGSLRVLGRCGRPAFLI